MMTEFMKTYPSLDRLLESISSVFDAYSVVLFCAHGQAGYELVSFFSLGDSIQRGLRIESGYGLAGWVAKHNKPLLVTKFDQKNALLGYYGPEQAEQVKVFLGCPLPGGLGVLCMDSKKTYAFTDKDQRVLALFADVVAAILTDLSAASISSQDQKLYRVLQLVYALREKNPKWSDFLNKYLNLLADASGYTYSFLVVSDEWGDNYLLEGYNKPLVPDYRLEQQTFSTGSGLLGWVFKKNQPIFLGGGKHDMGHIPVFGRDIVGLTMNTVLAFPLKVHTRCRGVLVFADRESLVIGEDLRIFAKMAADYLALFLENLYLKNRLKQVTFVAALDPEEYSEGCFESDNPQRY